MTLLDALLTGKVPASVTARRADRWGMSAHELRHRRHLHRMALADR